MSVTVHVQYNNLATVTMDLNRIGHQAAARNLNIAMDRSKGAFEKSMNEFAQELYTTGQEFSRLVLQTAEALKQAGIKFEKADEIASGQFIA